MQGFLGTSSPLFWNREQGRGGGGIIQLNAQFPCYGASPRRRTRGYVEQTPKHSLNAYAFPHPKKPRLFCLKKTAPQNWSLALGSINIPQIRQWWYGNVFLLFRVRARANRPAPFPMLFPPNPRTKKKNMSLQETVLFGCLMRKKRETFFFHPWSLEMEANECSEHNLSATRLCWVPTKYRTGFSFFSFFWECPSFPFPPLH